jgi:hypothetical protein
MRLSIRTANLSDYSAFYRVAHEVHEHHVEAVPDVFQSVDVVVSENDFAQLVHGDDSDVYVAECNAKLSGMLSFCTDTPLVTSMCQGRLRS